MHNRTIMLVALATAVLAFGAAIFAFSSAPAAVFCTMDARLDAPDGWHWQRDGGNDCAWTLYDAQGHEAPDGVYETIGEEAPPSGPPDLFGLVALIIALSAIGLAVAEYRKDRAEHAEAVED